MSEPSSRLVSILQIIGMLGTALTEEEFDALVDACFQEVGVDRPKKSKLVKAGG